MLEFVKGYPGGVAMTMGEVALAQGYDNAPTADNPGQEDADNDGIGDVVDDATLSASDASLVRNQAGALTATLENGAGDPIPGQDVEFAFDADGDGTDETHQATTDAAGQAEVSVTPTRPVGPASFSVSWDGGRGLTASDGGDVSIRDATTLSIPDVVGPKRGATVVQATLRDSDSSPVAGKAISFSVQKSASSSAPYVSLGSVQTNAAGVASLTVPTKYVNTQPRGIRAVFDGDAQYGGSQATAQVSRAR